MCISIASGVLRSIYVGSEAQEARCFEAKGEGIYHVAMHSVAVLALLLLHQHFILEQMSRIVFDEHRFCLYFRSTEALSRYLNSTI